MIILRTVGSHSKRLFSNTAQRHGIRHVTTTSIAPTFSLFGQGDVPNSTASIKIKLSNSPLKKSNNFTIVNRSLNKCLYPISQKGSLEFFSSKSTVNEEETISTETPMLIVEKLNSAASVIEDDNDDRLNEDGNDKIAPSKSRTTDTLLLRAKAKRIAMQKAKKVANELHVAYRSAITEIVEDDSEYKQGLYSEWKEHEEELYLAYCQVIKYVIRTKEKGAALEAQGYLLEMIERSLLLAKETDKGSVKGKKIIYAQYLKGVNSHPKQPNTTTKNALIDMAKTLKSRSSVPCDPDALAFPTPPRKLFHQILHSYVMSKARRKGLEAETLVLTMAELGSEYPEYFDTFPDSKAFALFIKCVTGSTYTNSLKKTKDILQVHDLYSTQYRIPHIFKDDPFLLMYSLKSLSNYARPEEQTLAKIWFLRLHSFCTHPENLAKAQDAGYPQLDLTSTYTHILREYIKTKQVNMVKEAHGVLRAMHYLQTDPQGMVLIDVKTNAYDLVISAHKDLAKKNVDSVHAAVSLLDAMVEAWKEKKEFIPHPSENSFDYCVQALSKWNDPKGMERISNRLMKDLEAMYADEENRPFEPSTKVYNSLMDMYIKSSSDTNTVLDKVLEVIEQMKQKSSKYPGLEPDTTSMELLLKACSTVGYNTETTPQQKKEALDLAILTFNAISTPTDTVYYHRIKCAINLMDPDDPLPREQTIISLFKEASQKGFVSFDVLNALRTVVSSDTFEYIVGNGRLADNWIENVTSTKKALYTDGSKGGQGKNARRKGKSTSGWVKKQKKKEEERVGKKEIKMVRKAERKKMQSRSVA